MLHPRLAANLVAFTLAPEGLFGRGIGTDPRRDLDFVLDAGFAKFGVSDVYLDDNGWDEVVQVVSASQAELAYLIRPNMFTLDDPSLWAAEETRLRRTVDATAAMGAGLVYGTTGHAGRLGFEEALAAFGTAVAGSVEYAASRGIELLVETTSQLRQDINFVYNLRDLLTLVEATRVGACADVVHCWREPALEPTIRALTPYTRLVQLSDWAPGVMSTPHRLVPGDGTVPLRRIIETFEGTGYAGVYDIELCGPAIDREGLDAFRRAGEYATTMLRDIEESRRPE